MSPHLIDFFEKGHVSLNVFLILRFIHDKLLCYKMSCTDVLQSLSNLNFIKSAGPDRNCASPIKWCKWPVWICWIYFRHPMGSLEALLRQFFINQSHNILASQLLICWIFGIILHTKANPMTEPIKINLYLSLKLFQPIVAKSALIG